MLTDTEYSYSETFASQTENSRMLVYSSLKRVIDSSVVVVSIKEKMVSRRKGGQWMKGAIVRFLMQKLIKELVCQAGWSAPLSPGMEN